MEPEPEEKEDKFYRKNKIARFFLNDQRVRPHMIPKPSEGVCFATLPKELREEIWKFSLPRQRHIRFYRTYGERDPIQLRICYESRQVALRYYKKIEAFRHGDRSPYVDLEVDTINWPDLAQLHKNGEGGHLPKTSYWDTREVEEELTNIKNVTLIFPLRLHPRFPDALGLTIATNGRHSIDTLDGMVIDALKLCPNLKEIVIEVYCRPDDEANFRWRP